MKRVGWWLGCVALCAVATGCWPQPGQGPDRAGYNPLETGLTPDTVGGLHRLWSVDHGQIAGDPVVSRAGVHVAAFDSPNSDGHLHMATYGADGQLRWTRPVGTDTPFKPQASGAWVVGDRVGVGYTAVLGSVTNQSWSGAPSFAVATRAPAGSRGDGPIDAARDDRTVSTFFRVVDQADDIGTELNDLGTGQTTRVNGSDFGTFTLGRQRLYRSLNGAVTAYELPPAGEPHELWTAGLGNPTSSAPVLSPDESTVYVVSSDMEGKTGTLFAIDAATGATRWTGYLGVGGTTPAVVGDTVYVQTTSGWMIAYNSAGCGATQCPIWWERGLAPSIGATTQPAVAGDVVYTAWPDGSIVAMGLKGEPLWWGSAGSQAITGGPVVSAGKVYVADAGGTLTAFGL